MSVNKDGSIKPQTITITLNREDLHTIINALDGQQSEAACFLAELEDIERGPDEDGVMPTRSRYNFPFLGKSFHEGQIKKWKEVKCKLLPYLEWRNKGTGPRGPGGTQAPVSKPAE